jgi:uroporphyrinogen decarboxylase
MRPLTHRERVLTSLSHEQPDRVPLDLGSSSVTEIVVPAYENLKRYLGFEHEIKPDGRWQRTVIPHGSILQRFDIDTRSLRLGEFKGRARKRIDADTYVDTWGITWKKTEGNFHMAVDGPFKQNEPKIDTLETFSWPDPDDSGLYQGLKERAVRLRRESDFAIVLTVVPITGIFRQCMAMRGFSEFLMDLTENTEYACRMMDIITDLCIKMAENALDTVGENVDILFFADDLGHQQSTFVSPKTYQELIKPRHRRFFAALKSHSPARLLFHSDGSIYTLVEDLIDVGVDALNPIQVSARNMDPGRLKKEFGDRLTFWGAIDTRDVLPFGSPKEVREEVRKIIDLMGKGGGYVLTSVHCIQAEVPPENIVAMFEEARSYGVHATKG